MIDSKKALRYAEKIVLYLLSNKGLDYEHINYEHIKKQIKIHDLGKSACFLSLFFDDIEVASLGSLFTEKLDEMIIKISKAVVETALRLGINYKSFYIKLILLDDPIEIDKTKAKNINPKKNCVIVSLPNKLGFVLPTTSIEYGFDSLEALEVACHKAGLGFNAWMLDNVKIYSSKAVIETSRVYKVSNL